MTNLTKNCLHCGTTFEKPYKKSLKDWNTRSKYCSRRCLRKDTTVGEKHYNWKGGITEPNRKLRHSCEYTDWRKQVFERDDYTCQMCDKRGVYIEANHILRFIDNPEHRLSVMNGITLCRPCHDKTKGKEEKYQAVFSQITGLVYQHTG